MTGKSSREGMAVISMEMSCGLTCEKGTEKGSVAGFREGASCRTQRGVLEGKSENHLAPFLKSFSG